MNDTSRAEKAGLAFGNAIVEMVHLMYQTNTAANFYKGLMSVLKVNAENHKKEWKANGKSFLLTEDSVGKFIVIWRGKFDKARVDSVDTIEQVFSYTVLTGADKCKVFNARFDPSQKAQHFDTLDQLNRKFKK